MSAPHRAQIQQIHPEALELLNNPPDFTPPVRAQFPTDTAFFQEIRRLLQELYLNYTDANEILTELSTPSEQWMSLRNNMTGAERTNDNPLYDTFIAETPFIATISDLRKRCRTLRAQQRTLEQLLPRDSPNPNPAATPNAGPLVHLPKTTLPTFSGECSKYLSFWNSFKAGVNDLPNLPDAIKLTYLKQCLTGPPLSLISSLPVTDPSYVTALDLLRENYGNPEDVARALHNSLRQLPVVRRGDNFCTDLRSLVDHIESICVQMTQQNHDCNTVAFQMEVEERLPRFVLDEIFQMKEGDDEWSTEKMKHKLRSILKRHEQINSVTAKQGGTSKTSNAETFPNRPPRHNPPQIHQNPSLTFHSQKDKWKPNTPQAKIVPRLPCLFCAEPDHFSSNCINFPDVPSRSNRLKTLQRCFKCLNPGHFSRQCPNPARCSNCRGMHPRALCPMAKNSNPTHPQGVNYSQHSQNSPRHAPMQSSAPFHRITELHRAPPSREPFPARPYLVGAVPNVGSAHHAQGAPATNGEQTNASSTVLSRPPTNHSPILLKCVRATLFNPDDPSQMRQGIVLLDDASTNTYISTVEAQSLKLKLSPVSIRLGVFNSPNYQQLPSFSTRFGLQLLNGRSLIVTANTATEMTQPTHCLPFTPDQIYTREIIPPFEFSHPVVLLGSDYYYEVEPTTLQRLPSGYHLIHTLLGPIVAGRAFDPSPPTQIQITNFCTQNSSDSSLQQFFSLETLGIEADEPPSTDAIVQEQFLADIEYINNRYQVTFPWKSNPSSLPLPSNFGLCMGRLRSTLASLSKSSHLLTKYAQIFDEQLQLGIIEVS
uniref:CCHC-type domain-containing protein n=1 Tax=Globodera rostochiensis TaxID=31243 RepID=A0A914H1J4_GLORO